LGVVGSKKKKAHGTGATTTAQGSQGKPASEGGRGGKPQKGKSKLPVKATTVNKTEKGFGQTVGGVKKRTPLWGMQLPTSLRTGGPKNAIRRGIRKCKKAVTHGPRETP